ncbi:hypothetical protein DRE_00464 [Drechslerella stenobrocha 248]|uniref:Uncharacterized protein n=1 Tax=Drechslerella stenobrocha 248 TaxID=1043628 RepID=W7HTP6_9PEZI|nr:hypothetical protein DRE_00464 [Drechslerella stenobrocha 248]
MAAGLTVGRFRLACLRPPHSYGCRRPPEPSPPVRRCSPINRRIHTSHPRRESLKLSSSTAVHASILEISPDHERLFKILKALSEKRHYDQHTTYFDTICVDQALADLSSENAPVKVASWFALMAAFKDAFNGGREALSVPLEPIAVRQGDSIMLDPERLHPMQLYADSLTGPELSRLPVHRILLVQYHRSSAPDQNSDNTILDSPLVDRVRDVESSHVQSVQSPDDIQISSDLAIEAITTSDHNTSERAWKLSNFEDLKVRVLETIRKQTPDSHLPSHVRDFIVRILTTKLPETLPSLDSLLDQKSNRDSTTDAVRELNEFSKNELAQQALLAPLRSFNPVTSPAIIADVTRRMENVLLQQTEARAQALDISLQQSNSKNHQITFDHSLPKSSIMEIPNTYRHKHKDLFVQKAGAQNLSTLASTDEKTCGKIPAMDAGSSNGPRLPKLHHAPNPELLNIFTPMRQQLRSISHEVNGNIFAAQRKFISSTLWGALGSGLIVFGGFDTTLGVCILAAILGVSNHRFQSTARDEWLRFCRERIRLAQQCLDKLKDHLHACSRGEMQNAADRYDKKVKELSEMKQDLAKARQLLLKMSPDLKQRFPTWL